MYEELVKNLRSVEGTWQTQEEEWMMQAADAIEELSKKWFEAERDATNLTGELITLTANNALPPVTIGMTIYYIDYKGEIDRGTVSMIQQKADKTWKFRISRSWGSVFDLSTNEIGKSVFLNSAEAEKHLKGH